jgi:amino acid adenylation domain-containing protein
MSDNLEREVKDLTPEEKRALLARLLKEKASQTKTEYPLAYGQRALWFVHQLAPQSAAYHIASTSRVRSLVDTDAFQRALQHLVGRHATLRTTYEQRDDQLIQVIHAHQEVYFEQIDASEWDEDELYAQVVETHKLPIDLANGPIMRCHLFTKAPDDHVFLITVHHIAFDGYSMFALLYDLKLAYDAEVAGQKPSLPPLKATYTDYVDRQMSLLSSEKSDQLKAYWLNQLSGELPIVNLPADFPRPLVQTYNGASIEFTIDTGRTAKLKEFAMSEGVTLYVLLLSIFQTLLHRYSGQDDVLIGSPNSNRDLTEFSGTVGYFVDPVVLRSTIDADITFKTLLGKTRKTVMDALSHQGYPFMLLVEKLVSANDPSRSPLFQVMFNLQSLQRIETTSPLFQKDQSNLNTLLLEPFIMPHEEGQFDLTLDAVEVAGTLWCALKYNTDLYEKSTVARMAGHYQTLFEGILTNPQAKLSDLPLLSESERHQLLVEWNNTQVDYPADLCVHQIFEQQVARTPNAIAVQFEDQNLTYDQLNRRANQLAHHLRSLGIEPDQKVGIYVERSLDMMVGLYAIHKAGAAYVPLDPAYPADRIAFMLEDSQVAALVTQENLLAQLPQTNAPIICITRDWPTISQETDSNPVNNTRPDNLCYMIYTSGSTGKPKGVMIEHRNVVNFFTGMDATIPHDPPGVWLAVTSTSFDISVLELFWTLMRGFTVVLYPDNQAQKLASGQSTTEDYSIPALISRHQVTHFQCTPSRADMLLMAPESAAALALLDIMIVGGEALSVTLANRLNERVRKLLINGYGPTETTIYSSAFHVHKVEQFVPIGRPIANTHLYILDSHMQPQPIGVPGELYIGGAGVVRGYWNRPELTTERFITDPFSQQPGARMYKTGDLARYLADGNVDFLGRNDFQVKIRGHRIELGELETLLDQHPAVQKSVVIAREDVPGDKNLVAYLMLQSTQTTESPDFRAYLRDILPDYMVPSAFVTLDAFPLTPNQKVDRKALPAPQRQSRTEIVGQNVPMKPMEILIADIWRDLLQVDNISVYDNFFDLGGHSLQVMQVVTRLESQTGLKIDPMTMRMQTLGQLAMTCETLAANPPAPAEEPAKPQGLLKSLKRFVTGKQDKV